MKFVFGIACLVTFYAVQFVAGTFAPGTPLNAGLGQVNANIPELPAQPGNAQAAEVIGPLVPTVPGGRTATFESGFIVLLETLMDNNITDLRAQDWSDILGFSAGAPPQLAFVSDLWSADPASGMTDAQRSAAGVGYSIIDVQTGNTANLLETKIDQTGDAGRIISEDPLAVVELGFHFPGVTFLHPGEYRIRIHADGTMLLERQAIVVNSRALEKNNE